MHAAVQFDDQLPLPATKVSDVRSHGMLATEAKSPFPQLAKQSPRGSFRFCWRVTKLTRLINLPHGAGEGASLAIGMRSIHGLDPLTRLASTDEIASASHPLPQRGRGRRIRISHSLSRQRRRRENRRNLRERPRISAEQTAQRQVLPRRTNSNLDELDRRRPLAISSAPCLQVPERLFYDARASCSSRSSSAFCACSLFSA